MRQFSERKGSIGQDHAQLMDVTDRQEKAKVYATGTMAGFFAELICQRRLCE
jgi:hypothetical protein